ncbi:rCG29612 [Rattus norvegicus]|uniref:RCG29612 n=1 Tax=Rattus norvegicus TaxID=10116 RepID=A6IN49_RAT|nr:rCG29612 [Rattus norvegicus]
MASPGLRERSLPISLAKCTPDPIYPALPHHTPGEWRLPRSPAGIGQFKSF